MGIFFFDSFEKIFGIWLLEVCVNKMWDDLYSFEFMDEIIVRRMMVFIIWLVFGILIILNMMINGFLGMLLI